MDCSQLIFRVLAADGIIEKVETMNSKALLDFFATGDRFIISTQGQVGDIALKGGHVAKVGEIRKIGKIHAINASNSHNPKGINKYFTTLEKYHKGSRIFVFILPLVETPDGKIDGDTSIPDLENGQDREDNTKSLRSSNSEQTEPLSREEQKELDNYFRRLTIHGSLMKCRFNIPKRDITIYKHEPPVHKS